MDYEASLNQALDLLADGEDRKALAILESGVKHVKGQLAGSGEDLERYYYWGRFLTAMEEYEQALLKFEKALHFDPEHEGSLWETASILIHDLDKPDLAKALLAGKLIPLHPDNELYTETLKEAEFLVRVRTSPPVDPRDADGVEAGEEPEAETGGKA